MAKKQPLAPLLELIQKIETDLMRVRKMVEKVQSGEQITENADSSTIKETAVWLENYKEEDSKIIEGVFDWYFMIWSDNKKYPVPMNYSSKSKLIPWDILKLRIMDDWKLIYKLITQAQRKFIKATLTKNDEGRHTAVTDDGAIYFLNQAAVTYFKGSTWDELSIIINAEWIGNIAAIEAVIPQMQ